MEEPVEPVAETPAANTTANATASTGPTTEQWHEWSNQRNDPDYKFHRKHPNLFQHSEVDMTLDHVITTDEM